MINAMKSVLMVSKVKKPVLRNADDSLNFVTNIIYCDRCVTSLLGTLLVKCNFIQLHGNGPKQVICYGYVLW